MNSAWGILIGSGLIAGVWLGPAAVPSMLIITLIATLIRGEISVMAPAVVVVATMIGVLRGAAPEPGLPPDGLVASTGGVGTVTSLPSPSPSGERVLVHVETIDGAEAGRDSVDFMAMLWLPEGTEAAPGDRLTMTWSIENASEIAPGFGSYVRSQGAEAVGFVWTIGDLEPGGSWVRWLVDLRRTLSIRFSAVLPGDTGALASGIVTGDDSGLSDMANDAFLRTGTSHITAVSGSNVSMLLALWNLMVRPGRFRRMVIVQVAIIASIWLYAVLVGMEPPAVRAALVASLGLMAVRGGRHPDPMTLLFLASAVLVMWDPRATGMVSFWLSFVASAALIGRLPADSGTGWGAGLQAIGSGVLFAYLATLPIVLAVFGSWSVSAVVANAALAPLMSLAFPLSFLLGFVVLVTPGAAGIVAWIPGILLQAALATVRVLSGAASPLEFRTTGWPAIVPVGMVCLILTLSFSQDGRRWGALVCRRWDASRTIVVAVAVATVMGALAGATLAAIR